MTEDERNDLHEQAAQLAYLAITYDGLHHKLENVEWDELADRTGKGIVALIETYIEQRRDELEAKAGRKEER